jgi:hypothetical protein
MTEKDVFDLVVQLSEPQRMAADGVDLFDHSDAVAWACEAAKQQYKAGVL